MPGSNNNSRGVTISGCGFFVPERKLSNQDLEKLVDTSDEWIRQRTGIIDRYIVSPGQASSLMAAKAAKRALLNSGILAEDIDLIIVATVTPDYQVPACACLLQEKIKAHRAGAFDLNAGCSGFVYGLMTGSQFIRSGTYKKVLVVGVDTLSVITDFSDRNTCVLLGDGAGAVVLSQTTGISGPITFTLGADGSKYQSIIIPAGGSLNPTSSETIINRQHYLKMEGRAVFEFAVNKMSEVIKQTVQQAGLNLEDISHFFLHQANLRILEGISRKLQIPSAKVLVNIERYGNTSSASLPILLAETLNLDKIKNGDLLLLAGFGAGLSWGVTIWRW